jgi:hypothetical protein
MTIKSLAVALALGGVLGSAAHADPRPPDPGKLQSGARPLRKGAPAPRSSVASVRPSPYPLELQFLGADGASARFTTTAGQPLTLTLELTNHGSAREFALAGLTWGMDMRLPAHLTLAPGETTRLEVTVTKRACHPAASFVQVIARADGDGALPVSKRASVRCR